MKSEVSVSIIPAPAVSGFKWVAKILDRNTGKTHTIYNDSKPMLRQSVRGYLMEISNDA
jgi:hypothetical protein